MNRDELKAVFNQQASGYEKQHAALMPIREGLYCLLESVFAELPVNASILCVGLGTGAEAAHLAWRFPGWSFTAVEPSGAMLNVFRQRAEKKVRFFITLHPSRRLPRLTARNGNARCSHLLYGVSIHSG